VSFPRKRETRIRLSPRCRKASLAFDQAGLWIPAYAGMTQQAQEGHHGRRKDTGGPQMA